MYTNNTRNENFRIPIISRMHENLDISANLKPKSILYMVLQELRWVLLTKPV